MPTPQQYAGQTGVIRPMNGLVPGMTWDQFLSGLSSGQQSSTGWSFGGEAGGMAGGDTGQSLASYDIPGLGSVGASYVNGQQPVYTQDVGDGTRNVFTRTADGQVSSVNQTQNNDSWWDSTGLPLVASLAFGGATAGLAAGGIGVSGAGAGAVNVGAGALGADGASAAFGGGAGAAGSAAGSLGTFPQYGTGFQNGDGLLNIGANAADEVLAPVTVTGSGAGAAAAGGGLTAGEVAAGAAGLGGVAGLSSSIGGGASGTGQSFSDANYSANNGLDYDPASGANWLDAIKNGYSAVKDITGLTGNQLLGSGVSLLNGILGSNAASSAASQQSDAIKQANALTAQIYGDTVNRNQPFVTAGTGAINKMADLNGLNGATNQTTAAQNFVTADPGYQFRMDQGNAAVANSAAAKGLLGSGRYVKDAQNYAQGLASQEYGNAYSRLSGVAQLGQNSANNTAAIGQNYAGTASNLLTAGGIANSAGTVGSTNAWTNALTQLLQQQQANGYYGV